MVAMFHGLSLLIYQWNWNVYGQCFLLREPCVNLLRLTWYMCIIVSEFCRDYFRHWLVACSVSSHSSKQKWFLSDKMCENKRQWEIGESKYNIFYWSINAFGNVKLMWELLIKLQFMHEETFWPGDVYMASYGYPTSPETMMTYSYLNHQGHISIRLQSNKRYEFIQLNKTHWKMSLAYWQPFFSGHKM